MSELVPIVDMSGWRGGDRARRAAIARQVDDACRRIGFLQLVGHGVDHGVRAAIRASADRFFELPPADKLRYRSPAVDVNRGYTAKGTESLAYSLGVDRPPDLFEAFNISDDDHPVGDPYFDAERHRIFAPNIWPDRPAGMPATWSAYFRAVQHLAHQIEQIFAAALGLPGDFFADKTDKSVDVLRANYYCRRPGDADPTDGQMRMGAHTDYGILTVLMADPVPGLQIVDPAGEWHDVVPRADGFVVNLGDALAVWTNDRWRSTIHRVVPPRAADGTARRRSFAFFHDGNIDAVIDCLPTCTSEGNPPKYAPITLGQHVQGKLLGPRTRTAPDATQTVGERSAAVQ